MEKDEHGQALPLLLVFVSLVAFLGIAVGKVANMVDDSSRAQNAADAIALAGVVGGPSAANIVAGQDEARIQAYELSNGEVQVTAIVAGQRAVARAAPGSAAFAESRDVNSRIRS